MSFYGWKPYVPVAERRRKAEKAAAKARKAGADLSPVAPSRGAIAKTFWGKAWSENLERYSDYANRLPRGRTYVRNGSVIDLKILEGEVQAQVMGSSLYEVAVSVSAVPEKQWRSIGADCAGSIDSLVELLQGKLSRAVMERICTPQTGLFPTPKEIRFSCSCPDWASMCKHVAAVLYGVGARLDEQPELIFRLRRVDAKDLVSQAGAGLPTSKHAPAAGKRLDDAVLGDVFGIEMADAAPVTKSAASRRSPAASAKPEPSKTKAAAAQRRVNAKAPTTVSAGSRKSSTTTVTAGKTKTADRTTLPKSTAARTGPVAGPSVRASKATQVTGTPAKARPARKATASGKVEGVKASLAARSSKQTVSIKASVGPRTSTVIVATKKAKTADATPRPKRTSTAPESVPVRVAKDKA